MVEESTSQLFTVDEQEKAKLAREAYLKGDYQGKISFLRSLSFEVVILFIFLENGDR